jgi:general stress protein 26
MKRLPEEIINFFQRQNFTIVTTIDKSGMPHNSCKGIVKINRSGEIYLMDLYKGRTYENLNQNPRIGLTAVDENEFSGYCLKGKAKIVKMSRLRSSVLRAWDEKITSRITQRVVRNIRGEKGHPDHPEALLPKPEYMIVMQVEKMIDLTPGHIK